ncbi:putative protein SHORT ROOT IN SALT MEDIUM 1 [Cocos nucifera]|nr:putative protein SHORT ROOT IN SALT MEDIUM 1 [Cocos nucifera]
MAERERRLATRQEKKSGEKKEAVHGVKGDESLSKTAEDDSAKSLRAEDSPDEKVEVNTDNISGSKKSIDEQKGKEPVLNEKNSEKEMKGSVDDKDKIDETIIHDDSSVDPSVVDQKPAAKKKTVRKVVKTKVVGKKVLAATVDSAAKLDEKMDVKDEGGKQSKQENAAQEDEGSAELLNVKTSVKKKVVRKVAGTKSAQKEDKTIETSDSQSEKKLEKEPEFQGDPANDKKEQSGTAVLQATGDKTPGKKKIVRKVIKRKVLASEDKDMKATNQNAEASKEDDVKSQAGKTDEELVEGSNSANKITEVSKTVAVEKESLSEKKIKEDKKDQRENRSGDNSSKADRGGSKSSSEPEFARQKDSKKDDQDTKKESMKDEEKKNKNVKHEFKEKFHKGGKEENSEEPPKHPGFFLQAKRSKGSKIRSMSLSLDGLLDYNDKDIEESTFELSLFAESFNEMLQYQMGCRILSFLEKLRKKFVLKRNQRKRERDDDSEKGSGKEKSSIKRRKTSGDSPVENECHKSEIQDNSNQDNEEKKGVDDSAGGSDEPKIENRTEDDVIEEEEEEEEGEEEEEEELEDPEEIFEEDQEMDDAAASDNEAQEASSFYYIYIF